MQITGTQIVPAPRQRVWDALFDPAVLKRCLPGCESVERNGADEFKVVMTAAIGPLKARFNGSLKMEEAHPPAACRMVFEGQGGVVGFGKGTAGVQLADHAEGTELGYTADAQVGGKLAQVGSRLIDSVAKKMADDFFKAFRQQLTAPGSAATEPSRPAMPPEATSVAGAASAVAAAPLPLRATSDAVAAPPPVLAPTGTSAASGEPAAARRPVDPPTPYAGLATSTTLVPGWWLAVAALIGAAATGLGAFLSR